MRVKLVIELTTTDPNVRDKLRDEVLRPLLEAPGYNVREWAVAIDDDTETQPSDELPW